MFENLFNEWDEIFSKMKYPAWVDKSKIKKTIKEENGGITIIESYSDGNSHWQSSTWTVGGSKTAPSQKELEKQLKKLIELENFEEAAIVRDKLKQLK